MFSKPLAFVLLALGCLTAAAGGAYVATRHNMSGAAHTTTAPAALAAPASTQPSAAPARTVAETEEAVTRPAVDPAPAPSPRASDAASPHAEAPAATTRSTARAAEAERPAEKPAAPAAATPRPAAQAATAPRPAVAAGTAPRPTPRTVPMTNAGAAVRSAETTTPAAAAPASAVPAAPKPDAVKPVEEPQPEASREPQYDELILPAAAVIGLQVETSLSSERARIEDRVDARVSRDVMAAGHVAIPAGSRLIGSVTLVDRGGKMKDQARLGIRFHTLVLADGSQVQLHTDPVYRVGEDPAPNNTKKIGGAAIGGAIIGAILGGGKGAAIGGATGAAGGTAVVMAGDRQPATLRPGEYLNVKLSSPATITVVRRE